MGTQFYSIDGKLNKFMKEDLCLLAGLDYLFNKKIGINMAIGESNMHTNMVLKADQLCMEIGLIYKFQFK